MAKKITRLFKQDIFNVVTPNKAIMYKKISSSIKNFNFCFFDNIKDLYIDKSCAKICLIMHNYNNKKKNIMLKHLSKISGVNQGLWDIT